MDRHTDTKSSGIDKLDEIYYHRHGRTGPEGERVPAERKLDKLLTIQEVCELLQVSKEYIYWLTHQRKIPFIKIQGILRFRKSAIDEWLRAQEVRSNADTEAEV
jgi:excisionase family DNA binding protein